MASGGVRASTNKQQTSTKRQDRTEETIGNLRDVALEIIKESGVSAITFATLAKRAGFSTSIVAYHFGSKAKFIQFLLDDVLERNRAMYTETLKGDNVADEFEALFARIAEATKADPSGMLGSIELITSVSKSSPELLKTVQNYNRGVRKIIEDVLVLGQERGSVDPDINAASVAVAVVGAVRGIILQAGIDKSVDVVAAFQAEADGLRYVLNPVKR